jgi:hypothetical protein
VGQDARAAGATTIIDWDVIYLNSMEKQILFDNGEGFLHELQPNVIFL